MIWGFGQFKIVIYVCLTTGACLGGEGGGQTHNLRLDNLDMAWTSCLKSEVTAFGLMTRREGGRRYKKDTNLNCCLLQSTCIAHSHFNTATFQTNIYWEFDHITIPCYFLFCLKIENL